MPEGSSCAEIAEIISNLPERERSGSLKIWGNWFGRPFDNNHVCMSCAAQEDHIVLHFRKGERLTIWNPSAPSSAPGRLAITEASRIRWEWYHYGRPQNPENLQFMDYENCEGRIRVTSSDALQSRTGPVSAEYAVELIGLDPSS